MELTKSDTMDEISISLPCGFSAKYKDIFYNQDKFPCPVCKMHDLTSQECLNMTKNKILFNEINLDLKKNQYEELMKEFENYKNDPKYYIDESYDCLRREVDLRREEIKAMINKKIDDYHEGLLKKIDMERDLKLKEIEEKIKNSKTLDLATCDVDKNIDIQSQLYFYEKNKIAIENGIRSVSKVIEDLKNLKFKLTERSVNIDIENLFGGIDWKKENKTIRKSDHIDTMDDLTISLPCGFFAKYKDIFYSNDEFPCPICKSHDITSQECLKMERNKLSLIEKYCDLKKIKYDELMIEFENYKNDPKLYIDESYYCLRREVDLRREEIKAMINKKIDDYHEGLLEKIDTERNVKFKELEERIKNTEKLDFIILDVDLNLDIESIIDFYKSVKKKIDNHISLVKNIIDDFQEPKFKLANSDDDIDIGKLFGELFSKEETSIFLNDDKIDDDNRAEATIQLKINNFSLLKDKKNFDLYSKVCTVRNFELNISINEIHGHIGFYLHCDSKVDSNKFSVNADAVFSLLNISDSNKNLNGNFKHLFSEADWGQGIPNFAITKEIMNPTNGYYDANDDSITLKAAIKIEFLPKNQQN